ncbi:MAG: hypothetical protein RIT45_4021 [Pseudomonadota bacterium]|jgi:diacylglycerol kinase family enzyme
MRTVVILNPASAGGRTGARFNALEPAFREVLGAYELLRTKASGDARRFAEQAVRAGPCRIVAVGGDGTNQEVAGGMIDLDAGRAIEPEASFGFVAMGTGGDLGRTFGVPTEPVAALRRMANTPARPMDAMRVETVDAQGRPLRRVAINVVSMGLGGFACYLVERRPKFGTTLPFYLAGLESLARSSPWPVRLHTDAGEEALRARYVVVANARYNGGGMLVGREAEVDDGLLDVVTVGPIGKIAMVGLTPRFYDGTFVDHPACATRRTAKLEVRPESGSRPLFVEADGEVVGFGPATITALPGVLRIHA